MGLCQFSDNSRPMGRLGLGLWSGPHVVGRLGSGPRVVKLLGSRVCRLADGDDERGEMSYTM